MVCGNEVCNDDFHIRQEMVNTRDSRFLFQQTYAINATNDVGNGFTASDVGFKIFLLWTVSFTDGTDQSYLAIVHLKGDSCEEHGWDDHPNNKGDVSTLTHNFCLLSPAYSITIRSQTIVKNTYP